MQIRFTRLCPEAQAPFRGSSDSAGYDLTAVSKTWDEQRKCWLFGTGLAVEIPLGYVGLLFPRSSVFKTRYLLANCVGVIDADYRGEIGVILINLSQEDFTVNDGERIAQMIIARHEQAEWIKVETLDETERGAGGFGHSGI